ncbi:hypothetical protein V6N11_024553 [Hibiscus sabdariffa]|uniref:Uncharacterized protein n=1 Tax=Hibiscus sabdariffa TaxID=183260 RepID=A0ABR2QME8_9ROSI
MCASIKFLAILVFLIAFGIPQISVASTNRKDIRSMMPYRTLLNDKASPSPSPSLSLPYHAPYSYFDVLGLVSPCWPFLTGRDSNPSPKCCVSAKKLAELTHTKRDVLEISSN